MNYKWARYIKSICAFGMVALLSTQVFATSLEDAESDKEQAENDKSKAQQILSQLESEKNDLAVYIGELDTQMNNLQLEIENLNTRKSELESEIEKKRVDIEDIKLLEQQQYTDMCARIQFMYVNSSVNYVDALLSAESMNDILNDSEYASALSTYDYNMLNRLAETRQELADAEAMLEQDLVEVDNLALQVKEEEDTVNELLLAKQEEMDDYNKEIANQEELVAQYDAEIQAAAGQIEAIEAAMRAEEERQRQEAEQRRLEEEQRQQQEQSSESDDNEETENSSNAEATEEASNSTEEEKPKTNGMVWPVPSSYRINSPFGRREASGVVTANHYGIDIGCPDGTPVVAAADGVVVLAQYSSTAGNWIIISHGNGMYTIYMHASALYVSAGQRVSAGDTIMLSGATGATQGRHLHFEVRVGGYISASAYSVDPMSYY